MSVQTWVNRPGPAILERGLAADRYQQTVFDAYGTNVDAPPCPVCGEGLRDEDFERHKADRHGITSRVLPFGKPDAREALFVGADHDEIEAEVATWRTRHPGVGLVYAADGRDREDGYAWVRFRLHDRRGRAAH